MTKTTANDISSRLIGEVIEHEENENFSHCLWWERGEYDKEGKNLNKKNFVARAIWWCFMKLNFIEFFFWIKKILQDNLWKEGSNEIVQTQKKW